MQPLTLPHRFRESSFRDYEQAIALIVASFPKAVVLSPGDKSPITYSCRLRDAMVSLHTHHWETDLIDIPKFLDIHQFIVVREVNGSIVCGGRMETSPKASVKPPPPSVLPPLQPTCQADPETIILLHTLEEKKLVCLLASRRLLATPLVVGGLSLDDASWLQENYDVVLTLNPDQTHSLI